MLRRIAPALFVLLWSSGFLGTKVGAQHAEPFTLIGLRFLLVLLLLVPMAAWRGGWHRLPWRQRRDAMIVGGLTHGGYIAGCASAMKAGMPAGVVALVTSLQPVLTAVLAGPLLGEWLGARAWAGLALGLAGACLIIGPKLDLSHAAGAAVGLTPFAVASAVGGLVAITLGTLYQKRHGASVGLLDGAVWQYVGALAVSATGSVLFETRAIDWTPAFVAALAWLVVVISIGAISLLMLLIRDNAVSRVSALFYLTPATTALMAYGFMGETLTLVQLGGMLVAMVAVLLIAGKGRV
jgi:drug/metabolite transporter (DMT)-like permease